MDQEPNFTMSSLPGFMSAGTHQTAIAAATKPKLSDLGTIRPSTTKRPPDQKSLLGFFHGGTSSGQHTGKPAPSSKPGDGRPGGQQLARHLHGQAINISKNAQLPRQVPANTELLSRSLNLPKPKSGLNLAQRYQDNDGKRKHYAQFSSSPQKPEGEEERQMALKGLGDESSDDVAEPTQAAMTTHVTTCTITRGMQGFNRPAAPGRSSIAPLDRLRKPFKPLTINRP